MESKSTEILLNSSVLMKSRSSESSRSVSSSLADPSAMYKNCCSSLSERRAEPSAILTGMEVHALRICEVNPNLSSGGNFAVSKYIFLTIAKLCFQTSRFWCGFINEILDAKSIYSSFLRKRKTGNRNKKLYVTTQPIPNFLFSFSPLKLNKNEI